MDLAEKISAFSKLGDYILSSLNNTKSSLDDKISEAFQINPWFTEENQRTALKNLAENLSEEKLADWLSGYRPITENKLSQGMRIGVILAGNLPLVGFHDFLCILFSGNIFTGKPSSGDTVLLKFLAEKLIEIEPRFGKQIIFIERLDEIDAVIATGSNNSNRYFEYYFGKYPHLFRRNRNSAALIDGSESKEELELLADDIFLYFGLGCRNVSKIYFPDTYDFEKFFPAMEKYSSLIHHNKYANNYHYQRTIYSMSSIPFLDNGFMILKHDESFPSPVSVIHYENYIQKENVFESLRKEAQYLQCFALRKNSDRPEGLPVVRFGETQSPQLNDYADGVDTMKFLLGLAD